MPTAFFGTKVLHTSHIRIPSRKGIYHTHNTMIPIILNFPWTLLGLLCALISFPTKIKFSPTPPAVILQVRSFWWYTWLPKSKGARAMALGNVVLLGPNLLEKDLEHELVHVEQAMKEPLIHPFLYQYQNLKYGYKNNKYEKEAYEKAGNTYVSQSVV
jgi:hypothetical protein